MYGGPSWASYLHSLAYFVYNPGTETAEGLAGTGTRRFQANIL